MICAKHIWSSLAMALSILANLALLRHLCKLHRCVRGGGCVAVELGGTSTIKSRRDFGGQLVSLILEVALVSWALGDLASLLFVVIVWIQSVAPRLVLALIWVAAIIVVAESIAPSGHNTPFFIFRINWLCPVCHRSNLRSVVPWKISSPLLASASTVGAGHQTTVALALGATLFTCRI